MAPREISKPTKSASSGSKGKPAAQQAQPLRNTTNTPSKVATPPPKARMTKPLPGSVCKSVKKGNWKRRPKPAHSGVPVPEKLKKLLQKQPQDLDCSL